MSLRLPRTASLPFLSLSFGNVALQTRTGMVSQTRVGKGRAMMSSTTGRTKRKEGEKEKEASSGSSSSSPSTISTSSPQTQTQAPAQTPPPPKSWLTQKVESSPTAARLFFGVATLLGYESTQQVAGRQMLNMYEERCVRRADEEVRFWREACHLPPTFQSWFTVTNLHVWMLTVRLRALPSEYSKSYQQALIDHFFIDIEDRVRTVLQPSPPSSSHQLKPYTSPVSFYTNPNAQVVSETRLGKKVFGRAPDRLVMRQMRIFKEQWMGMGLACDLGMVKGDMELAAAVWRNLLGARGGGGIVYPSSSSLTGNEKKTTFHRAINLVGGLTEDPTKIKDLDAEAARDDGSGVHDFAPGEVDLYLAYPQTMLNLVGYVRRELKRLDGIENERILKGDVGSWGKVKGA